MSNFKRNTKKTNEEYQETYNEKLIKLNRVAKVVKGGRRFSFSALVAVGDMNGRVGVGFGKANEVADSISKASQNAKKTITNINLTRRKTIPHETVGVFKGSKVVMRPASPGTGVIAGGAVRSIMEVVGIRDILTKILGSKNQLNVAKAAMSGLQSLRNIKEVAERRGKKMADLF
ncbi:MAG: 30S ribosomal protein S5 [Spirochaetes bacterium]|nr:30S ribosomal protein S5 [Spirochaetota bacterium]